MKVIPILIHRLRYNSSYSARPRRVATKDVVVIIVVVFLSPIE